MNAKTRLSDYKTVLKAIQAGVDPSSLWLSFLGTARLRLGGSAADVKIPFAWGTELQQISHAAVRQLITAINVRHKGEMELGEIQLPRASWGLRKIVEKKIERSVALELLATDSFLDGGVLDHWLNDLGGKLLHTLVRSVEKGADEQRVERLTEPTAYLTACVCTMLMRAQKEQVKRVQIRGVKYDTLERAVGLALAAVSYAAFHEAYHAHDDGPIVRLLSTPWIFVSIRQSMLSPDLNPYGLSLDLVDRLADLVTPDSLVEPLADQVNELAATIQRDKELARQCAGLATSAAIRKSAVAYLARYDLVREPARARVAELVMGTVNIAQVCAQEPDIATEIMEAVGQLSGAQAVAPEALQNFAVTMSSIQPQKGLLKRGEPKGVQPSLAASQWVAARYLCFRLDEWAAFYVEQALARFDDKGAEFDTAQLKEQYDTGRLYRFAPDKLPALRSRIMRTPEGHLFADIKGFTRRTVLAKAVSTADFLKNEFYEPVLDAAANIGQRDQIELNNLLGDAVSFSGTITALVALGDAVAEILRRYKMRLQERDTAITTQQVVQQIRGRRDQEIARIDEEVATIRRNIDDLAFEDAGLDISDDVAKLHVRLRDLDEQRERSIADAAREIQALTDVGGLEAGIYLAFGSPVEPIEIHSHAYGQMRIAIAEGINESARGTARARFVRDQLDAGIQRAIQEGRTGAKLPFDVYVLYSDRIGTSDIYNVGQAISREAVDAYIRHTRDVRFYEVSVGVPELPSDIRDQFVFLESDSRMMFVLGLPEHETRSVELFRFCGMVTFKGFEEAKPTQVFERIPPVTDFFKAMGPVIQHWFRQLQGTPPLEELLSRDL